MVRPTIALAIACSTLFGARSAQAQASFPATHTFSFSVGVAQTARFDEVVSPDRFGGFGPEASFSWVHPGEYFDIVSGFHGGTSALDAASVGDSPERALGARAHFAVLVSPGLASDEPRLGIDLLGDASLILRSYPGATGSSASFGFGTATVGPAVLWPHRIGGGTAALWLSVPVYGMVVQPYSDLRGVAPFPRVQWAGASNLQGVSGALSYEPGGRTGIHYEYRADFLRYNGPLSVRSFTQSVSIGFAWGRKPLPAAPPR